MSKQFLILLVVIVLALVGVSVFSHKTNNPSSGSTAAATHHVEGNTSSGVALVEYGDYQCPYCQAYYTVVKQVVAQNINQMSFQFRNYPLTSVHQNAFAAARAAEAADMQGKFWEMHDMLYQNNDPSGAQGWVASNSPTTYFDQFAQQLGLNLTKFKADYASSAVNDRINADLSAGNKLNIQGTPTFYLNGKQIQVTNNAADFQKLIDAAVKSKAAKTQDTTTSSGSTTQTTK